MNANLEEAANIATEYLASLENLPSEAQHILTEIKHRESRTQELAEEIRKETQKYFRHSAKAAGQHQPTLPPKDASIPENVHLLYAEVDALAADKAALADRLVRLFERAMARLSHDLNRVLKLQGDEPGLPPTQHFLSSVDTTMRELQASLRMTAAAAAAVESPPASAPVAPPPQKKRKVTAAASAGSIKLPSPAPVASSGGPSSSLPSSSLPSSTLPSTSASASGVGGGTTKASSGLARQVHPRQSPVRSRRVPAPEDEDAEGEEEDEGADAEDQELYCYCQKLSYGEMIACDNENCRYQWFHISCVNLPAGGLPETWYCDDCSAALGIQNPNSNNTAGGRKGRKK